MSKRICSDLECDADAAARGMCHKHWKSWRRSANPAAVGSYVKQGACCSADGCTSPPRSKNLCSAHYKMLLAHGTPTPRRRAEVVDGKRMCPRCHQDLPLAQWGKASCCKACNRANANKYSVPAQRMPCSCLVCARTFEGTKKQRSTCSSECRVAYKAIMDAAYRPDPESLRAAKERWRKANLPKAAEKERRRNARKRGAIVEPVDVALLWTGLCGICGGVLDENLRHPDPMSRSLDHIVPLSKGGPHTQINLQWTHLRCNVRKGAKLVADLNLTSSD